MTDNVKELREYRTKLYSDIYSGVIPDRIPVNDGIRTELAIQFSGLDLLQTQYSYSAELLKQVFERTMDFVRGDNCNFTAARNPVAFMLSKNSQNLMSKSGFIQHPETEAMQADEYDKLTENPMDFLLEVVTPRMNAAYSSTPAMFALSFARQYLAKKAMNEMFAQANKYIADKYGFFRAPAGSTGATHPPFDYITDNNRGFSNIVKDIRRTPQKVLDAIEAVMPFSILRQKTPIVDLLGSSGIMTHMGVFLNMKDFDKFYWPTFYELCHIAGERGQRMAIFCEGDWTRFADHLLELPSGTRFQFEYGNAPLLKDKLGKKHILGGLYPLTLLKHGTCEQCIDKAKELIDIMAPGGNYFFDFDKHAVNINDINTDNYSAVQEYVKEYGKYDNAGERANDYVFEDTVQHFMYKYPEFKSKYIQSFDEFIADYPYADESVLPIMKENYEKYMKLVPWQI